MRLDETVHQHAVAVLDALGHNPFTFGPAVQLDRAGLQLVVFGDDKHHLAKRAVNHRTLRHAQTVGTVGPAQQHPHKLAGPQAAIGVGNLGPHIKTAGLRIDFFAGKVELAGTRVGAAIGQFHAHGKAQAAVGSALARHAQLPGVQLLVHAQQITLGHAEVHKHRVGLHNGGEQAVARRDEAALRLGSHACGAVDGCGDPCVAQVQPGLIGLGLHLL